jgi:redox-sensitive bicupin YhaK (pirin superfamily)
VRRTPGAGQATSDGAGVKLVRVLTQDLQRRLDPFLMLDAFGSDNPTTTSPASPTTRTAASRP